MTRASWQNRRNHAMRTRGTGVALGLVANVAGAPHPRAASNRTKTSATTFSQSSPLSGELQTQQVFGLECSDPEEAHKKAAQTSNAHHTHYGVAAQDIRSNPSPRGRPADPHQKVKSSAARHVADQAHTVQQTLYSRRIECWLSNYSICVWKRYLRREI